LLDRFGSKAVYFTSIFTWSLFTLLQGAVRLLGATAALYALFILRFSVSILSGQCPSSPLGSLPTSGAPHARYSIRLNISQMVFAPIMGWITTAMGWPYVFYFMGLLGIGISLIWLVVLYSPDRYPRISLRIAGGVLGGIWSDLLLRTGWSLTVARKTPIVSGLLLSVSMIICNYVGAHWFVIFVMALAIFGKGIGALGWAVIPDAYPKEIAGFSGGLFNMFGNLFSITTPLVIGYIIQYTGSFNNGRGELCGDRR
jgi:MFS family permease